MFGKILNTSLLLLSALAVGAQTQLTDADLTGAWSSKAVSGRVVCHDPSIFIDNISDANNPKFYIYGSHLGRGYTTEASNYLTWTTFKTGEESSVATNSLFANTSGTLVNFSLAYNTHAVKQVKDCNGSTVTFGNFSAHGWQYKGNTVKGMQWAPDVIYNKTMKKWCMYMSLNGDYWCSSIVCFTSSSPEGPWIYQGPVVFSGFGNGYTHNDYAATDDYTHTDFQIATGETSLPARYKVKDTGGNYGNFWPNCIDPCVFYDDDDNLWMSYGSWSGGIFMLKLNPENGLRDYTYKYPYEVNNASATPGSPDRACTSDPYFGKKIAGGYYVSGEASYIQKIGNYYFLFMSYGELQANGGYQMRVFRSDNPTGPYTDPYGTSAIYKSYKLNYTASMADARGMLLFGGYQWDNMPVAEIAQGHNSAFNDLKGRSFVVYHTRFNNGSEGHQVRMHQLFLNEDGWISAAPNEFHGETITSTDIATRASIADSEIPGDYQFLRHQYFQDTKNKAYETPVNITLTQDGKITGSENGSWTRTAGTDFITLTIADVDYKGVLVKQTLDYTNISSLCIAAVSSSSGAVVNGKNYFTYQQNVWASKADAKAAIKYTLDKMSAPFYNGQTVTTKPTLPKVGLLGVNIRWESSNTSVLTDEGVVKGKGDVTMTMVLAKDGYEYRKAYNITVNADAEPTVPVYYPVSTYKNTTSGWWVNFSTSNYTLTVGKSMKFQFYNYSNRENNWDNWCLYGANYPHGASGYSEYFGVRCDNWDNTTMTNTGCTSNYNWDTFLSDMDGSLVDMTVNYSSADTFTMSATITTTTGSVYSYAYTKNLSAKPAAITLFFVSEGSYIDGSILNDIASPFATPTATDGAIYNLSGQRVGADYKGIVIRNGRKYVQR